MGNEEFKVLIIGGGLGGLALAQMLRARNISFEIFERDESLTARKQGWAVTFMECLPHLEEMLPKDLGTLTTVSVNYETGASDSFALCNSKGEKIAEIGGVKKPGEEGFALRASRIKTREHLWPKINVQTGKPFSHYTQDRAGVTAFFEDGSSARGSLLVGADGAHSRVRKQLLGDAGAAVEQSVHIPVAGEVTLPRDVYEKYYNIGTAGLLVADGQNRSMIGLSKMQPDAATADYYFSLTWASDDPVADNAWVQAASRKTLYAKALEMTAAQPAWVADIIRRTGEAGMVAPPFRFIEFAPPAQLNNALPRGRVTLLGDAAHTMIPFRGAGANTALLDACDLVRLISSDSTTTTTTLTNDDVYWLLQQYEEIMIPRARRVVFGSRAAGDDEGAALTTLKDVGARTTAPAPEVAEAVKVSE